MTDLGALHRIRGRCFLSGPVSTFSPFLFLTRDRPAYCQRLLLPLFTQFPTNGVLGNLALSCVAIERAVCTILHRTSFQGTGVALSYHSRSPGFRHLPSLLGNSNGMKRAGALYSGPFLFPERLVEFCAPPFCPRGGMRGAGTLPSVGPSFCL